MRIDSCPSRPCHRSTWGVLAVVCLAACSIALPPAAAEAGSLVIPAWSFARGNARVYADPDEFADAGPVVGSGPERPSGWTIQYDIDVPVTAKYTLQICYAAAEARPIEIFFDGRDMGKCCTGVTFGAAPSPPAPLPQAGEGRSSQPAIKQPAIKQPAAKQTAVMQMTARQTAVEHAAEVTWNSSGAKWEGVHFSGAWSKPQSISAGKHTLKFTRSGPLPHLVALRLETPEEFPEDWKPPRCTVRDIDSVPVAFRQAFSKAAVLPPPLDTTPEPRAAGSLTIPAWTFDRGNIRIYASPDEYADAGPAAGGGPEQPQQAPEEVTAEYDVDFPVTAEYTLKIRYAAGEARPVDVWLDDRHLGKGCTGITIGTRPTEYPVRFSWNSREAQWEGLYDPKQGRLVRLSITEGRHRLKITRRGPLPHLTARSISAGSRPGIAPSFCRRVPST